MNGGTGRASLVWAGRQLYLKELSLYPRMGRDRRWRQLVEAGADVLLPDPKDGLCALALLSKTADLLLLRGSVEGGRPAWHRPREGRRDPVALEVLAQRPDLPVVQYLVQEAGMPVHGRDRAGRGVVEVAQALGLRDVAAWLRTWPGYPRPQEVPIP